MLLLLNNESYFTATIVLNYCYSEARRIISEEVNVQRFKGKRSENLFGKENCNTIILYQQQQGTWFISSSQFKSHPDRNKRLGDKS